MTTTKLISLLTPKRTWFQFRLVTLLVCVAVICVVLALRVSRQDKRRVAIAGIESVGGKIIYLSEWTGKGVIFAAGIKLDIPQLSLSERLLGDDPSNTIVAVYFEPNWKVTDVVLANTLPFTKMRVLVMGSNHITDAGLLRLKALSGLQLVTVDANRDVTEAGVAEFQKALPKCKIER